MTPNELTRLIVHDHTDAFVCEIDPAQVASAVIKEEVNGEHTLTLTTSQEISKTDRIILQDGMGTWFEYVVLGITSQHRGGGHVFHEYYCVWSLQYDLSATYIDDQFGCGVVPGHPSNPQPARRALECALEGTARWAIGTITVTAESSASFYRRSGWDGMKTVLERWGGELQATITVSTTGVVGRAVDLLAHVGASPATRRFDYGADLTGIKRTFADEVWPCRIVPLGKSVETDAGGYTRRPSIESVNQGIAYLQDDSMVQATRVPDGLGGWEYPTIIVKNDTYEDPADLKLWAQQHITDYTTPKVSYEAKVAQFAEAGLDPHGVALGDDVAIVDRTFGNGGLRIMARVTKLKRDLCDPARMELTIGNAGTSLAAQLGDITRDLAELSSQVSSGSDWQTTNAYMAALLDRLNAEINADGGYWYMVPGYGTRTYDVPVSDPAVGAEASKVVEVKGGTIRIATKDQGGNWDWHTVVQNGLLVADTVKALDVNAGIIRSYDGSSYWDLDTGEFVSGATMEVIAKLDSLVIDPVVSPYTDFVTQICSLPNLSIGDGLIVLFKSTANLARVASVAGINGTDVTFNYTTSVGYPTKTNYDGTTYSYSATITSKVDGFSGRLVFDRGNRGGYDAQAITLTEVRVYKLPIDKPGVIRFEAKAEGESSYIGTTVEGGSVSVQTDGFVSQLTPGVLTLSSTQYPSTIQLSKDILLEHRYNSQNVNFRNLSESAPGYAALATNTDGTNHLPGLMSGDGMKYTTDSNVPSGASSISSLRKITWGPFILIQCTCTIPNNTSYDPTATSGRSYSPLTLPTEYQPEGWRVYGSGRMSSTYVPVAVEVTNLGTVNLYYPPGTYTAAGRSVDFSVMYLKKQ